MTPTPTAEPSPKVLVFGGGFLGRRLVDSLARATLSTAEITDPAAVRAALDAAEPDAVINAAGKTGRPNVDWCEAHREATWRSNVAGPLTVAEACAATGTYLLHLGSGCVFYGDSPAPGGWREGDLANPRSYYSRSKYAADLLLAPRDNVAIARLRMPVDGRVHPRNLVTKLAGYSQVIDVENSVTVVDDFVAAVDALVRQRAAGIFHVTNPGTLRHRDLLALYRDLVDPDHRATLIRDDELVARGLAKVERSNCVLADTRLGPLGITLRPVAEALVDVMRKYAVDRRATA